MAHRIRHDKTPRRQFAGIRRTGLAGTYGVDVHSCPNFPPPPSGSSYFGRFKLTAADYSVAGE